ncbi:MAG TPA: DNA repair protein RecN [Nitrospiraceae bacterium]|jgi:DNA repair protein RecN (Recombination protein N)|nr:DNA repair protein RecN [Nitrospiraceae bacterium]
MLTELRIANFGVIEQLALQFDGGFTVFTGETGAGKSLLIDAVTLLVGGRASAEQIRADAEEADLEASFVLSPDHGVLKTLEIKGFARSGDPQIIVRRVLSRGGRHRTFINGNLCPLHLLEELGGALVDIHGQHDQQSLLSPVAQLNALDAYGRLQAVRTEYDEVYAAWRAQTAEIERLKEETARRREREDVLRYQLQELSETDPQVGEDAELERERPRLMHGRQLRELSDQVHELLYADDSGLLTGLSRMLKILGRLQQLDPETASWAQTCTDCTVQLRDLADQVRRYRDTVDDNADRLVAVEQRLDRLHRLSKKYGGSLDTALAHRDALRKQLARLDSADSELASLEHRHQECECALRKVADRLSRKRAETADKFAVQVSRELAALKMDRTGFSVLVSRAEPASFYGPTGQDVIEFLFSANPGEPLKPLGRVASGGELSRVMLALKTILAEGDRVPVLIFDEIDAGVGGAVAEAMGKRLRGLAKYHQVFSVTHLPQVGAQAHAHFLVEKLFRRKRTTTQVRKLDRSGREGEIARMLAGMTVTKNARAAAADMIGSATDER